MLYLVKSEIDEAHFFFLSIYLFKMSILTEGSLSVPGMRDHDRFQQLLSV